jgi:hypothetical protein
VVRKILRIIKNTHRHPVNQALHSIGAPFYGLGLLMSVGHLGGIQTNLTAAGTMLLAAIAMFVLGHKIEGNIRSMMPVLLFRFLYATVSGRKVARYSLAKRVHLLWT